MNQTLCTSTLLASHNSGITYAQGYGLQNFEIEMLFQKMNLTPSHIQLNNQKYSLYDQLKLGVRFLELDVHRIHKVFRIAHCGGFYSPTVSSMVEQLSGLFPKYKLDNIIYQKLWPGRSSPWNLEWDLSLLGCQPSFSGIYPEYQQSFTNALREIKDFVQKFPTTYLVLFLDMEPYSFKWIDTLISIIEKELGSLVLWSDDERLNTFQIQNFTWFDLKREAYDTSILIVMKNLESMTSLTHRRPFFSLETICPGWIETSMPSILETMFKSLNSSPKQLPSPWRPVENSLRYGPWNGRGKLGPSTSNITLSMMTTIFRNQSFISEWTRNFTVEHLVGNPPQNSASALFPAVDLVDTDFSKSMVWLFHPNDSESLDVVHHWKISENQNMILVLSTQTPWPYVYAVNASEKPNISKACRSIQQPSFWILTFPTNGACPNGTLWSIPITYVDAYYLWNAMSLLGGDVPIECRVNEEFLL